VQNWVVRTANSKNNEDTRSKAGSQYSRALSYNSRALTKNNLKGAGLLNNTRADDETSKLELIDKILNFDDVKLNDGKSVHTASQR